MEKTHLKINYLLVPSLVWINYLSKQLFEAKADLLRITQLKLERLCVFWLKNR